jgi:hypothetical protein
MYELNNQIARLEIRTEQFLIHLSEMGRNSAEAQSVRSYLLAMLEQMVKLKTERQLRVEGLAWDQAA